MPINVVRAWIDPEYRKTLTPEELARVPPNPAAPGELSEEDIKNIRANRVCYMKTTCRIQDSSVKTE